LRQTISDLTDQVIKRLKKSKLTATTVKIKIRWPDFTTVSRQMSFQYPIQERGPIFESAISLFDNVWQSGKSVRLIGIGVANLHQPTRQLNLFDENISSALNTPPSPAPEVQKVVEQLRQRFGEEVIIPASHLGKPKRKQ
jgi:DNA polymerase-4